MFGAPDSADVAAITPEDTLPFAVGDSIRPTVHIHSFDRATALKPSFMGSDPLAVAPLAPEDVLRRHAYVIASDSRFRSATRLLAALWRESRPPAVTTIRARFALGDAPAAVMADSHYR